MASFNLDPNSYSNIELKNLLCLADDYTHNDVMRQKQMLMNQLRTNNDDGNNNLHISSFIDVISNKLTALIESPILSANTAFMVNNIQQDGVKDNIMQNEITQHGSNVLIKNKNSLVSNSKSSDDGRTASSPIKAGYMNPINVRTIEQTVNIDSRFRKDYYSSLSTKFSVQLPVAQKNVVKMTVDSIEFPLSYYSISSHNKNNTFLVVKDMSANIPCDISSSENTAWLVTIPDGNYEASWMHDNKASSFEDAMNMSLFRAIQGSINEKGVFIESFSGPIVNLSTILEYSFERKSGKSVFTVNGDNILTMRFNGDNEGNLSMEENIQLRLGWVLGFRGSQYISGTEKKLVSEGICYPSGPSYGFLAINDYQNNTVPVFLQAFSQSILDNNIITKINLGNELGASTVFKSSDIQLLTTPERRSREYFGPVNIQKLDIALYDEYGRIINLNNMDISISLRFEKLYD